MKELWDDTNKYNAKQHYVWRIDLNTKAVQARQGSQTSQDPQSRERKYILLHKYSLYVWVLMLIMRM